MSTRDANTAKHCHAVRSIDSVEPVSRCGVCDLRIASAKAGLWCTNSFLGWKHTQGYCIVSVWPNITTVQALNGHNGRRHLH
jgi:hypothetical protein